MPDSTLPQGKESGDHWVFPWLCWVSSLGLLYIFTNILLASVNACMTLVHNQYCWLAITKKALNNHQTFCLVRRCGLGMRLGSNQGPIARVPLTFLCRVRWRPCAWRFLVSSACSHATGRDSGESEVCLTWRQAAKGNMWKKGRVSGVWVAVWHTHITHTILWTALTLHCF